MSTDSKGSRFTVLATRATKLRLAIGENLQKYGLEDLVDDGARIAIEAQLAHQWLNHNEVTIPKMLRELQWMQGEQGGSPPILETYDFLQDKEARARKGLSELADFLSEATLTCSDLSWEVAQQQMINLTLSLRTTYQTYYKPASQVFVESTVELKVLALPMRTLCKVADAFKLPAPSEAHLDAAMKIVSGVVGLRTKCDAVIEIVNGFDDTQTCLSALMAIDETWMRLEGISTWLARQTKRQVAEFERLQAIMSGSTYVINSACVPAPSGSDLKLSFQDFKDMHTKLHNFYDLCIRGCMVYDTSLFSIWPHVAFIQMVRTSQDQFPMQWARNRPVFFGIFNKCILQTVDPSRYLEDQDYAEQVFQAEEATVPT